MGQKVSEIGQKTIAEQVSDYIDTHPVTRNALQHGIVNYSALTRLIQEEIGTTKNFEAILIAVRRNAEKLTKLREHMETRAQKILVDSNFEIKTKVAVLTIEKDTQVLKMIGGVVEQLSAENIHFHFVQGSSAITFIIEQKYLEQLKKIEKYVLKTKKDLVEVIIKSSEQIENVPGVDAMILNTFSERNINLVEMMSCYTDTVLILNPDDLSTAVKLLDKLLKT
jgi:aspartokinase